MSKIFVEDMEHVNTQWLGTTFSKVVQNRMAFPEIITDLLSWHMAYRHRKKVTRLADSISHDIKERYLNPDKRGNWTVCVRATKELTYRLTADPSLKLRLNALSNIPYQLMQ
jgi:hypothetical protein